jgi:hypothetical protein
MTDGLGRRKTDVFGTSILEMIRDAATPGERAVLSVMLEISLSLDSNTRATTAIAERLEEHAGEFRDHKKIVDEKMADASNFFSRWGGVHKAFVWVSGGIAMLGGAVVGLSLYVLSGYVDVLKDQVHMNLEQERRIILLEQHQQNPAERR